MSKLTETINQHRIGSSIAALVSLLVTIVASTVGALFFLDQRIVAVSGPAIHANTAQIADVQGKLDELNKEVRGVKDSVESNGLERQINELRKLYCTNPRARETLSRQITTLQQNFQRLNGHTYPMQDCEVYG